MENELEPAVESVIPDELPKKQGDERIELAVDAAVPISTGAVSAKVAILQAKVQAGEYHVDSERVALAMLDEAVESDNS